MGQEWDFGRRWKPTVRWEEPSPRRFDRVIDHDPKKRWNLWDWYKKEMKGDDGWLYKVNLSLLVFTVFFFIGLSAAVLVWIAEALL